MKSTNRGKRRAQAKRSAAPHETFKAESHEAAPAVREQGKHARGYFVGLGMVAGTVFGVPFGFATANPAMVWAGLAIGISLGTVYERKYNHGLSAFMK